MNSNKTLIVGEIDLELPKPVSDLEEDAVVQIGMALRMLLADAFALYIKTKNFHWHMSGAHFRDHHLLLDEQAGQIFAIVDDIAERARKIGAKTIRSIADIGSHQRLSDNSELDVTPRNMSQQQAFLKTGSMKRKGDPGSSTRQCRIQPLRRSSEESIKLNHFPTTGFTV